MKCTHSHFTAMNIFMPNASNFRGTFLRLSCHKKLAFLFLIKIISYHSRTYAIHYLLVIVKIYHGLSESCKTTTISIVVLLATRETPRYQLKIHLHEGFSNILHSLQCTK